MLSLGLALVVAAGAIVDRTEGFGSAPTPASLALRHAVHVDAVTGVMLALVCFIGFVIIRYSRTYLEGEPGQRRYARALLATLAAVTVLVLSSNLLVVAFAWTGTSLALHRLLTFYRERPQALVAAHKKFLLSRFADACMLGTLAIVGASVGSLDIDAVDAWALSHPSLSPSVQVAAVLVVLAVAVKSAQLPFHGWLTQVMEAPTPVSALLHAGVVNIGGVVLIRLAPLMERAPAACTLLLLIGTTSVVAAALVMTTRVSVKVALAWSTCAQMGFMLVECGLGAWHLALLHLASHSLYKAHAFLRSGSAVDRWTIDSMAPRREPAPLPVVFAASAAVLGALGAIAALAHVLLGPQGPQEASLWPMILLLGLSFSPLVASAIGGGWRTALYVARRAITVTSLYGAWHVVFGRLVARTTPPVPLGWVIVLTGFVVLFGAQAVLASHPHGRLARALQPRLFAGLYLDELFTRWTFRLWPPRLKPSGATSRTLRAPAAAEVGS